MLLANTFNFLIKDNTGEGSQDVLVAGMSPKIDVEILGSSSDHTLLDLKQTHLKVGDEVRFSLSYGALLSAMTSPYVAKEYIQADKIKASS